MGIVIGISFFISVVAGITVDFSATPTSGIAPLPVQFTDLSSGSPTGWAWFFGDESYAQPWTLLNAAPGWAARFGMSSVVMPDGSIVLMGGEDNSADLNDTWRSTDNGVTWAEVNMSSGWAGRVGHTSVMMPDGSIVLMGGAGDTIMNDTWRSTDNGATWALMNASSGWAGRYYHASVALPDGSIILNGGRDDSRNLVNDTWRSTDNGATWMLLNPSSGWSARNGHAEVVMPDGSIILMGGYDGTNTYNDTWRSADNGATWARVNANPGWPTRQGLTAVAMPDGSIVLMGGYAAPPFYNDTWRSTNNGITWTLLNPSSGWAPRLHHASVAMPDGSIVILGGMDESFSLCNNVWRFQPVGSSLQNPAHTYAVAGTYPTALQVFNEVGYSSTQKSGYITASPPPQPSGGDSDPVSDAAIAAAQNVSGTNSVNVGGNSAISLTTVTGKGISGLIVTGFVLAGPGPENSPAPGTVYQYLDLTPARFSSIDKADIAFSIPRSWLNEHHISVQDVVMYHLSEKSWNGLPTTFVREENGWVYYRAVSTGFSRFAIAGKLNNESNTTFQKPVELQSTYTIATITPSLTNSPGTQKPIPTQTVAVPVSASSSSLSLPTIILLCGAGLCVIVAGILIHRWWIRRQNPALFRKYD
ncbi:MAG: kelch repeat-containing protein [Methanoregula sp.]|nr:kelch repeat-containing protein [Methanoregula sp.]